MANIVSVASQKGGVGKTTTALNLAYSLSRFGERTLVLDADPQGSLAAAANLRKRTSRGLVDLLRNEASVEEPVNAPEVIKAINSVLDRADARTATKQPASVEHSLAPELMAALERAYGDVSEDNASSHRDEE